MLKVVWFIAYFQWYPCISNMTNVLTCLPASGGGSVVDYVFMKECDPSMVIRFKIGPLSQDSNHKPVYLYLHIAIKNLQIDQCIRVQKEMRYVTQPGYQNQNLYSNEVESCQEPLP